MTEPTAARIRDLCRLALLFRLVALNVTIFYLPGRGGDTPLLLAVLLVAIFVSYVPMRMWSRIGPRIVRQPLWMTADVALSVTILVLVGPWTPFFLYTLGSALLGGVIHQRAGAIAVSAALLAGYYAALAGQEADFERLVTLPVLYPLLAAGGAAVRRLLDRQAETEAALLAAGRAAVAGEERARVAREMHDSLGKTLYGIGLTARGLAARLDGDERAAGTARDLAGAAERAAGEARDLIDDLRSDALELPLAAALRAHVGRWSQRSGVTAAVEGDEVDLLAPGVRYELFSIVKEALRNVERHSHAARVTIGLRQSADCVDLEVADDGIGMAQSGDPRALEPDGHWGLVGMAERAERIGATVHLRGEPGRGTTVSVRVPARDVRTPEPWELAAT